MIKGTIVSAFFLCALISCSREPLPPLAGIWECDLTLKSELGGEEGDSGQTLGYLYTRQRSEYTFNEDGTYTRKVVQAVDRVEFSDAESQDAAAKDYFSQYFDKTLVFAGEYRQQRTALFLTVDTVQSGAGEPLPYDEFHALDESVGADRLYVPYERAGDGLVLGGVAYRAAAGSASEINPQ